jgi:hypothetical protein
MARWKLITSHYLAVENNHWEYVETDRSSGKQLRKRLDVPMQLDCDDPACWNVTYRNQRGEVIAGEIIVAHRTGAEHADDIIFLGEPTPDMLPIDDEAKVLTKSFEKKWNAKPDEERPYGQLLVEQHQVEMAKVQAAANVVKIEGMAEIMKTMSEMLAQNQVLMQNLVAGKSGHIERRV